MKMKAIATLVIICLMGCFTACTWQTKQSISDSMNIVKSKKEESIKQLNLLDEQTKMYSQIFNLAGAGENNPIGEASNYVALMDRMDLPKEQQEMLYEQYKIYDLSLDLKKQDSITLMIDKLMTKAIIKSQNQQ